MDNEDSDNKAGSMDNMDNGDMVVLDSIVAVFQLNYIRLVKNRLLQHENFEIAKYYLPS